jgi:SAM-dependent methyltransferase
MADNPILWKQAVEGEGLAFGDDIIWPAQPYALPLPNAVLREASSVLREASSVSQLDAFYFIGEAWAHMVAHYLPQNPFVLDIGCACGKLARFLYMNPNLTYLGIDIFRPAIEWAKRAFCLAGERFRFEHFDGYSALYNPGGTVKPNEYILPCLERSVDTVVCASLFTHLMEPDCFHYLVEIARVLKTSGKAIISIHTEPQFDLRFSGDEARIDVDPGYFIQLAGRAKLQLHERVGLVCGQEVLVFGVAEALAPK